jgi:predicted aminopeptidase
MHFSVFLDGVVDELAALYARPELETPEVLALREGVFTEALERFRTQVQPDFVATTYGSFLTTPLNNATLLSRMLYYHRLPDFQALQDAHGGDLMAAIEVLRGAAGRGEDPFSALTQALPQAPPLAADPVDPAEAAPDDSAG